MADLIFNVDDFLLDEEAVKNGAWIDFGGGAMFKLAPFDNPSFQDAFRKANKTYESVGRAIPEADQEEIMCRTISQFCILDWKKVFKGKDELKFSTEEAYKLLKEYPRLRARILTVIQDIENFKAVAREEAEGN